MFRTYFSWVFFSGKLLYTDIDQYQICNLVNIADCTDSILKIYV